jgi:hypothetical protein
MKYDDIIDLPHPTSTKHPRMSMHDRAAQFSPFAALTGHEEAIEETAQIHTETFEDNIGDNNAFSTECYK